mmetsp:Transcript_9528/g.20607  ORF Transcript_9528/g.20607 Transcript_9528/m.20607 type:complete len:544 (-) Transcript_9528:257-1888(-)
MRRRRRRRNLEIAEIATDAIASRATTATATAARPPSSTNALPNSPRKSEKRMRTATTAVATTTATTAAAGEEQEAELEEAGAPGTTTNPLPSPTPDGAARPARGTGTSWSDGEEEEGGIIAIAIIIATTVLRPCRPTRGSPPPRPTTRPIAPRGSRSAPSAVPRRRWPTRGSPRRPPITNARTNSDRGSVAMTIVAEIALDAVTIVEIAEIIDLDATMTVAAAEIDSGAMPGLRPCRILVSPRRCRATTITSPQRSGIRGIGSSNRKAEEGSDRTAAAEDGSVVRTAEETIAASEEEDATTTAGIAEAGTATVTAAAADPTARWNSPPDRDGNRTPAPPRSSRPSEGATRAARWPASSRPKSERRRSSCPPWRFLSPCPERTRPRPRRGWRGRSARRPRRPRRRRGRRRRPQRPRPRARRKPRKRPPRPRPRRPSCSTNSFPAQSSERNCNRGVPRREASCRRWRSSSSTCSRKRNKRIPIRSAGGPSRRSMVPPSSLSWKTMPMPKCRCYGPSKSTATRKGFQRSMMNTWFRQCLGPCISTI